MRRFVLALAILLCGLVVAVAPASIVSAKPVKNVKQNEVSGPFTGTSTYVSFPPGCPFLSQVFDATYTAAQVHRTGSVHLDGCTSLDGADTLYSYFSFFGTATVTTPAGTVLAGTASGRTTISATMGSESPGALDITLSLLGPGGPVTVHLTGVWQKPFSASGVPGPISGTLTAT